MLNGDNELDPEFAEAIGMTGSTDQQNTAEMLMGMGQAIQNMADMMIQHTEAIMNQQAILNQQTMIAFNRPKRLSIGNIQKDAAGNVIGVTTNAAVQ